jgi:predicted deacylase
LNPNQWEVNLIEFKFCEDTRPDPQLQKAKAQHSMHTANLNRQGYREVKLHVILVGAMGTTYKDYTDKPLADLILDYHTAFKKLTHKLNEHSIRHASALTKTRYALQYNTSNNIQGLGLGATAHNPPDPH